MFSKFESKIINFQELCFYNEFEKARNLLSASTSRQQRVLINSLVKENYPIILFEDDHLIGFSPIHLAIEGSNIELVEMLIKYGANVNKDSFMGSPLQLAVLFNRHGIFDLLLQSGADINQIVTRHTFRDNAYHLLLTIGINPFDSVHADAKRWIKKLFKNGCNINEKNSNGDTALYLSPASCISSILKYGGDINLKNNEGKIPLRKFGSTLDSSSHMLHVDRYIDVIKHVQKLRAIDCFIDAENLHLCEKIRCRARAIDNNDFFTVENISNLQKLYHDECIKLKNTKITTKISLYDIIHQDHAKSINLCKNQELKQILTRKSLKKEFPHYGWLLTVKMQQANNYKYLMEPGMLAISSIFKTLPENCIAQILLNLDNNDLKIFHN